MVTVAVLSPIVPEHNPANAGEKLVWNLCRSLQDLGAAVTIISEGSPRNRLKETDFPTVLVEGRETLAASSLRRLHRPVSSWTPQLDFLAALLRTPEAYRRLKTADVIDLQWASMVLLAPLIRRINPTALLVGTLHDVNSQRLSRRASREHRRVRALIWSLQGKLAGVLENSVVAALDRLVVLSEKDAALLGRRTRKNTGVRVISPPVYDSFFGELEHAPDTGATPTFLLMGSMYRWENQESLHWLVSRVMPLVWQEQPRIRLAVVGPAPEELMTGLDPRVDYRGVSETVSDAYREVWAALVPLRLGAGVKFKTVDALLAGVPVIATYAGAEGICRVDWVATIAESPQAFAAAMLDTVSSYPRYRRKALAQRAQVREAYGLDRYRMRVKEVYDL